MHTVKVIFQGGGARLPALIAASEVLSEFEKEERIQISHIYGVSAGAIAGCMLATKSSMAAYREKTRRAGATALQNLPDLPTGLWGLGRRVLAGSPILPEEELRKFLRELFSVPEAGQTRPLKMSELKIPATFYAANIQYQSKIPYDRECGKNVVDVLCDSCALPFIFRTYAKGGSIVDGGLAGNLPADDQMFKADPESRLLAFGFRDNTEHAPQDALRYGWALVCASMETAVSETMSRVQIHGGKTCLLPNKFSTLQFDKAISEGLEDGSFGDVKELIQGRLDSIFREWDKPAAERLVIDLDVHRAGGVPVVRDVETRSGPSPAYNYHPAILRIQQSLSKLHGYKIMRSSMVVTANCLWPEDSARSKLPDAALQIAEFVPTSDCLLTIRVGIAASASPLRASDVSWWIEDVNKRVLQPAYAPVAETRILPEGERTDYSSVFVFDEPVAAADCPIKVFHSTPQMNAMQRLKTAGIDWIRSKSSQAQDVCSEDIVLALPQSMASVGIHDLLSYTGDIPREARPPELDAMRLGWTRGRAMTDQELQEYRPLVPHDSSLVGWRSTDIPPGNYTGIAAVMPPKSSR